MLEGGRVSLGRKKVEEEGRGVRGEGREGGLNKSSKVHTVKGTFSSYSVQ